MRKRDYWMMKSKIIWGTIDFFNFTQKPFPEGLFICESFCGSSVAWNTLELAHIRNGVTHGWTDGEHNRGKRWDAGLNTWGNIQGTRLGSKSITQTGNSLQGNAKEIKFVIHEKTHGRRTNGQLWLTRKRRRDDTRGNAQGNQQGVLL